MNLTKKAINIIMIFYFTSLYSQSQVGEIKITERFKNISHVSGKFNDSITFHLLINKNKDSKKYESKLVFFGTKKIIKTINVSELDEKPKYLGVNVNDNVVTFVNEVNEEIQIYDIDYLDENIKKVTGLSKPLYSFSSNKCFLFIYSSSLRNFDFALIKNTDDVLRNKYRSKSSAIAESFPEINLDNTVLVDNEDFIHKGFINNTRLFYSDNELYVIKDYLKDEIIKVVKFKFNGESDVIIFKVGNGDKIKKLNAFISNNLLFSFCMHKKIAQLNIHNLESNQLLKSL